MTAASLPVVEAAFDENVTLMERLRMMGLVLAVLLALQASALTPEASARIAPVVQAVEAERVRQATLPPPANDRERLERMGRLDQSGRRAMNSVDLHDLPPEQMMAARSAMWRSMHAVDEAHAAALLEMVPPEGWFYKSVWGDQAASAAFLIVQHSDETLWRRLVPVLEPLVATGEVDGGKYALMYDRLALSEGRPQRYGSQMICRNGRWAVDALEDHAHVDERRAAMGMVQTLAEYEAGFADFPPCNAD